MGFMGTTEVSRPPNGNRRFGRTNGPVFSLNEARFYTLDKCGIHDAQRDHPSADALATFSAERARGFLAAKGSGNQSAFNIAGFITESSQWSCLADTALTRVRRRNINGEGLVEALVELRTAMPAQSGRSAMPIFGRLLADASQGLSGLILRNQLVAATSNGRAIMELSQDRRNTDGRADHSDPQDQGKQTAG
jgi:hypothetical protein